MIIDGACQQLSFALCRLAAKRFYKLKIGDLNAGPTVQRAKMPAPALGPGPRRSLGSAQSREARELRRNRGHPYGNRKRKEREKEDDERKEND